jgi:Ca2+-binding RTX toxin-like protein
MPSVFGTSLTDFITPIFSSFGVIGLPGNGDDQISAGDGDDFISAGAGNDTINGGAGIDTAAYSDSTSSVSISLTLGSATGGAGIDALIDIENIIGSNFADTITGNSGNNRMRGDGGNDTFFGTSGNDTLEGAEGSDSANYNDLGTIVTLGAFGVLNKGIFGTDNLVGIESIIGSSLLGDTVDHSAAVSANGVIITGTTTNLATGAVTVNGTGAPLPLSFTVRQFEHVIGSNFADAITGNSGANSLNGGAGDDTLNGGAGPDTLNGVGGSDTATFVDATAAVSLNLTAGTATGGDGDDLLIEIENLIGSSFADAITGNSGANRLGGGAGNDTFFSSSGNDTLNGGAGSDTASYSDIGTTVTLSAFGVLNKGSLGSDSLNAIESIIGSSLLGDTVDHSGAISAPGVVATGTATNLTTGAVTVNGTGAPLPLTFTISQFENVIGSAFADAIAGNSGANSLNGGTGNDVLFGTAGNDTLNGGADSDTANYSDVGGIVTLGAFGVLNKGALGTDNLIGIETIIGSSLLGDTIDHSAAISGASVVVTGTTTNLATGAVTINGTGTPLPLAFTVRQFEHLIGSNSADAVTGTSGANSFSGGAGNDTLIGGTGNDSLNGGEGNDLIFGDVTTAITAPIFTYNNKYYFLSTGANWTQAQAQAVALGGNLVTVNDAAENQFLVSAFGGSEQFWIGLTDAVSEGVFKWANGEPVSYVNWATGQPDNFRDEDFAEFNSFGAGKWNDLPDSSVLRRGIIEIESSNDYVIASAGNDTINTGIGRDTVDYSALGNTVTLGAFGGLSKGSLGTDTLIGVETIIGSILFGDTVDHSGAISAPGVVVTGTSTNLTTGVVSVSGTGVPLPLSFTVSQFENVVGSAFPDAIAGDSGTNILSGRAGNDTLVGGMGNDSLNGGEGNDLIFGDIITANTSVFTYNNKYYLLGTAASWSQAQAQAAGLGGNLVTINDAAENQFLVGAFGGTERLWIGYTDSASEGTFRWANGESTSYTNWIFAQPDDFGGAEDCAEFNFFGPGLWNDIPEPSFRRGIIEIDGYSDSVIGSAGNDTINGGSNSDTVNYSDLGTTVTLGAFGVLSKGALGTDNLISIETVIGSIQLGDTVDLTGTITSSGVVATGTSSNLNNGVVQINGTGAPLPLKFTVSQFENVIGSAFADAITGNSSANSLSGGVGDDTFFGSSGSDTLTGGANFDTANYSEVGGSVTISAFGVLNKGALGTDNLIGIEAIIGSNFLGDTVDHSSAISLPGVVVTGTTTNLTTGAVIINGAGAPLPLSFTVSKFENVIGSAFADGITGNSSDNSLNGGSGDDILNGRAGNDTLNGGSGSDTATFEDATAAVSLSLIANTVTSLDGNDELIDIENVRGSTFADTMTGGSGANSLSGSAGNDTFFSSFGNDTLNGGVDSDTANYNDLSTTVTLGAFGALNKGSLGTDTLISVETIIGSSLLGDTVDHSGAVSTPGVLVTGTTTNLTTGAVTVNGTGTPLPLNFSISQFENVIGSNFADAITGNSGANSLSGAAGNDTFFGSSGNDTLNGGGDSDTANYSNIGGLVTLGAFGVLNKDALGTDNLIGIETIIGSSLLGDTIDHSGAISAAGVVVTGTTTNLTTGAVSVNGTGAPLPLSFRVNQFENVIGSAFADAITGNSGANSLSGAAGDDTLNGGAGIDTLNGGSGSDTAIFADASTALSISLTAGTSTVGDGNDVLIDIENVIGTNFADAITGNSSDNNLRGASGNDTFFSSSGNDTLNGGADSDTANYNDAGGTVSLGAFGVVNKGTLGTDNLIGIETIIGSSLLGDTVDHSAAVSAPGVVLTGTTTNLTTGAVAVNGIGAPLPLGLTINQFENVIGSNFADTITGNSSVNVLSGTAGNDTLFGSSGNDTLNGGADIDTANYTDFGNTVTLGGFGVLQKGALGTDTLIGIESIIGSSLLGDTVDYSGAISGAGVVATGTTTNLASGSVTINGTGAPLPLSFTVTQFEHVIGSNVADAITGNANANSLSGADGDDALNGGADNDTLNGGGGSDTATFVDASAPVSVSLATGVATSADGNDVLIDIEHIIGSTFADAITGNSAANILNGAAGNDTFLGSSGNDTLTGGADSDTANYNDIGSTVILSAFGVLSKGSLGSDHLIGIETIIGSTLLGDTVDHSGTISGSGVLATGTTTNLATGVVTINGTGAPLPLSFIVKQFEQVIGSAFTDAITGNSSANILNGAAGNDTLNGGAGNDTLNGGSGSDTATFADATASVSLSLTTGKATGGDGSDVLISIEHLIGGNFADTIIGNSDANKLSGGDGDDTLNGGAGNDTLTGGVGSDTATFADATAAISLSLNTGTSSGGAGSDVLLDIENVNGSNFSDGISGSGVTNVLIGAAGDDTLSGFAGNDILNGGTGKDNLIGGMGKDILSGGADSDTFMLTALSDSPLSGYDVITDYNKGEILDRPGTAASVLNSSSGTAAGLSAAQVGAILNIFSFTPNSSNAFTAIGFSGTFVAFNDAEAGFAASKDSIVYLPSYNINVVDTISIV